MALGPSDEDAIPFQSFCDVRVDATTTSTFRFSAPPFRKEALLCTSSVASFLQPSSSQFENNYFTEMFSGSDAVSYLRLIAFVCHSTLGLRVIKKKKKKHPAVSVGFVSPIW